MNQHSRRRFLSALTCALIALLPAIAVAAGTPSPAAAAQNQAAGRLVIKRSAHLGSSFVSLSIDGKEVAKIGFNGSYDAPLAAGPHVLTVFPIAGREHPQPFTTRITVEPGKTYTFTLVRSDVSVILK
jgi:hypothetical protein